MQRARLNFFAVFVAALAALALAPALIHSARAAEVGGPTAKIIDGDVVPNDPSEWPFIVALLQTTNGASQYCGGSLIKPQWVLTAAHCVDTNGGGVTPGAILYNQKNLLGTGGQLLSVASVHIHPQYSDSPITNDIALIRLAAPPSNPVTIEPATTADDPPDGASVGVAGWGSIDPVGDTADDYPTDLYEATLGVVSQAACTLVWSASYIFPSNLCATDETSDTCFGDSGGPLVYDSGGGLRLAGLTSWGPSICATVGVPGVYTRVSSFDAWIAGVTGRALTATPQSVSFGVSVQGGSTVTRTIKFTSSGVLPVSLGGSSISPGGEFTITRRTCDGAVLPPGSSCEIDVTFNPSSQGSRSATLSVASDSSAASTTAVGLYGSVVALPSAPPAETPQMHRARLSVRMPRRSRKIRGRRQMRSTFSISYSIPTGVSATLACRGRVRLSVRVRGIKRNYVKRTSIRRIGSRCGVRTTMTLPRKARRKRASIRVYFAGNEVFASDTYKRRLTIR